MNGLYPIIRRVRRPLLPVDWPADAKPAVVPVSAETKTTSDSKRATHKEKHGEVTSAQPAE